MSIACHSLKIFSRDILKRLSKQQDCLLDLQIFQAYWFLDEVYDRNLQELANKLQAGGWEAPEHDRSSDYTRSAKNHDLQS